jgi:hypothetical protein
MSNTYPFPKSLEVPLKLGELIVDAAAAMAEQSTKAFRVSGRRRGGKTLRPGPETPLWNELRAQVRPLLVKHGEQALLARMLGLPRQRVNDFVTGGGQMPDAERTLQLLAWLMAAKHGQRPA